MAGFNGAGVFERLYNWANDAAASIKIRADRMDNEMNGFATGLSQCVTRDGQSPATDHLPMGGFKHTNVGAASARNEYATAGAVQDSGYLTGTVGGTADVVTLALSPAITAYAAGQSFSFISGGANTGAVTLNVNGVGAKAVTKRGSVALVAGDIANGALVLVEYDGTRFQMLNANANTVEEEATQTLTNKTLTAPVIATISNTGTLTLPTSTDTLVGRATTDTLTNKTLTSPTISSPTLSGTSAGNYTLGGTFTLAAHTLSGAVTMANSQSFVNGQTAAGDMMCAFVDGATRNSVAIYAGSDGNAPNGTNTMMILRQATGTGRSINARGTVNASGADYAEYERKREDCGEILPGQVVGFDADGLLTDKWAEAVSFGIKSTNPNLVGGDAWGLPESICPLDGLPIGERPEPPADGNDRAEYDQALAAWEARMEAARQQVDRIAYCGKCPVNVYNAEPGDFLIPLPDGSGISAVPVRPADVIFEEVLNAIGRVRRILPDGRAEVTI